MRKTVQTTPAPKKSPIESLFSLFIGVFLALALLKWGNPIILDSRISAPTSFFEYLYQPWPLSWGYGLLFPLTILGLFSAFSTRGLTKTAINSSWEKAARFLPLLPLLWAGWQLVSTTQTTNLELTSVTLPHLLVCAIFFYLGYFGLRGESRPWAFCAMITLGLLWVIKVGFEQHFGGLAETFRMIKQQPDWQSMPRELIEKFEKGRIFSTLCYPNTLAGAIILVLPISLVTFWTLGDRFSRRIQILLVSIFGGCGLACLYWSNSKAGWLIVIVVAMIALWLLPIGGRPWKRWVICALLVLGLTGFFVKYAGFFKKGATSVAARFDYWTAAVQTTKQFPLLGSGPGTFAAQYAKLKKPESEFARLTHNDYLEQASDSGIPGFLAFSLFIVGSLAWFYYRGFQTEGQLDLYKLAIWLGLFGLSLHECAEFHLYVPALAWTQFLLFGWMWAREKRRVL